jgi:hypothetical protein
VRPDVSETVIPEEADGVRSRGTGGGLRDDAVEDDLRGQVRPLDLGARAGGEGQQQRDNYDDPFHHFTSSM